jgi:hypothetical protein
MLRCAAPWSAQLRVEQSIRSNLFFGLLARHPTGIRARTLSLDGMWRQRRLIAAMEGAAGPLVTQSLTRWRGRADQVSRMKVLRR